MELKAMREARWALEDLDILANQLSKVAYLSELSDFISKRTDKIRQAIRDDLPIDKADIEKII